MGPLGFKHAQNAPKRPLRVPKNGVVWGRYGAAWVAWGSLGPFRVSFGHVDSSSPTFWGIIDHCQYKKVTLVYEYYYANNIILLTS